MTSFKTPLRKLVTSFKLMFLVEDITISIQIPAQNIKSCFIFDEEVKSYKKLMGACRNVNPLAPKIPEFSSFYFHHTSCVIFLNLPLQNPFQLSARVQVAADV